MARDLYAAGPGLLISSPSVLATLEPGDGNEDLTELFARQQLVLLMTGSPQLDYTIEEHLGGLPGDIQPSLIQSVRFGLDVSGGSVVFRDGYDLDDWKRDDPDAVKIPAADDYYAVEIGWLRSHRHSHMMLHVGLTSSRESVPGEGSADLLYLVH